MWRSDVRKRNHRCGESRFIEQEMEIRRSLHGTLGLSVTPRDIAKVFVVSDPRKRADFDKAANKDEAWRRYRDSTSMDDYPGLHTLLGH